MQQDIARIEQALDQNDLPAAARLAADALAAGIEDPLIVNLVAWRYEEDGRFAEAETTLRDALRRWPGDASLHVALGIVLRKVGRLREAVEHFDHAIEFDSAYSTAWFERGATFERGGALADAAADFRQALALDPQNAAAHASLGAGCARRGDRTAAVDHAHQALRLDPANLVAHNALALVAIEDKRFADAIALLEPVLSKESDMDEATVASRTLLGDAYEGAGRFDDAYRTYCTAQQTFHAANQARLGEDHVDALDAARAIGDALEAVDTGLWRTVAAAPAPVRSHVFLTGYPRSGTTLVENILATLPDAVAIEERRTLGMVDRSYLDGADGLARFAGLSDTALRPLRDAYWDRALAAAGEPLADRLFVDMDPFKGLRLPIISKLFPAAKVVIMRRDPRDVVWSCFHTSFAFNAGTIAFSSLESTARHYALTQRVIERSLRTLPIDAFELRYETLVRSFDETTQALCAFLDVPWDAGLRQFDRTAARRGVSTASTTQVRKGLYDGSGGWRRYERQLAAVAPTLAPWIERFGYRE